MLAAMRQVAEDTPAVDCYGPAGTVILWHHRLGHNPGTNHVGMNIRQAVLFDYIKSNVDDEMLLESMGRYLLSWLMQMEQAARAIHHYTLALDKV